MLLVLLTAVPQRGMAQMGTAAGPELVIGASTLTAEGRDRGRPRPMDLRLTLSKAAAWRAFLVADPIRLIVDVKGLDFGDYSPDQMFGADLVPAMRWGRFGKDWSRIVLELPGPYRIEQAYLRSRAPEPQIHVSISPVSDEEFAPDPARRRRCAICPIRSRLPRSRKARR